tara:strand:+ start:866 stop:1213 length:348 start_codon:yes stop_codon:yes gene_type:complete
MVRLFFFIVLAGVLASLPARAQLFVAHGGQPDGGTIGLNDTIEQWRVQDYVSTFRHDGRASEFIVVALSSKNNYVAYFCDEISFNKYQNCVASQQAADFANEVMRQRIAQRLKRR